MSSLLIVEELSKTYRSLGRPPVVALDQVSLTVPAGQITGLVGESGTGKSTLIRCIMGLTRPDSGTIDFDRINVRDPGRSGLRRLRREVQIVFQDPTSSLNPRMTVGELVEEGMIVHKLYRTAQQRRDKVMELLESVGLPGTDLRRLPSSFSGGQRQRIAIARALAVGPRLLVCDEPVSSLDVSVQAQVLNLLQDRQEQLGLTVLFVAHDLAVIRHVCSSVAVINAGRIVESGPAEELFTNPKDPYTRALLDAIPVPDPAAARR